MSAVTNSLSSSLSNLFLPESALEPTKKIISLSETVLISQALLSLGGWQLPSLLFTASVIVWGCANGANNFIQGRSLIKDKGKTPLTQEEKNERIDLSRKVFLFSTVYFLVGSAGAFAMKNYISLQTLSWVVLPLFLFNPEEVEESSAPPPAAPASAHQIYCDCDDCESKTHPISFFFRESAKKIIGVSECALVGQGILSLGGQCLSPLLFTASVMVFGYAGATYNFAGALIRGRQAKQLQDEEKLQVQNQENLKAMKNHCIAERLQFFVSSALCFTGGSLGVLAMGGYLSLTSLSGVIVLAVVMSAIPELLSSEKDPEEE